MKCTVSSLVLYTQSFTNSRVKGVQSMHIYRYPEVDPEASKWLFKAPLGTVLPAVPVPVLQHMENINTAWPKLLLSLYKERYSVFTKHFTYKMVCRTLDLKPLIKDGNLQVCMYCRHVRKEAS